MKIKKNFIFILFTILLILENNLHSAKPRGMYVWNSFDIVLNTNTSAGNPTNNWVNLFGFSFAPHHQTNKRIRTLYITPYKAGTSDTLFDDAGTPNRKQMLRKFIKDAHSKDFRVEAVMGDPSWATPSGKASGLARVQQLIDYNLSVNKNERFDGLLLDIEPDVSTLSGWTGYTDFLSAVKVKYDSYNSTNEPDMSYGDSISPFYDNDSYSYTTIQGVMDRCSVVAIMSYYESGDGIVARASNEIRYGDTNKSHLCKTRFGVETMGGLSPETISFFEEGVLSANGMEDSISYAESFFNSSTSLEEVFIHHFVSYAPERPYTDDIPTYTPSTYYTNRAPVVRIFSPNGGEVWSGSKTITWNYQDVENNSALLDIYISIDRGQTWSIIANNIPSSSSSYTFNTASYPDSTNCLIKIVAKQSTPVNLSSYDKSDGYFTIANGSQVLSVTKNIDIASNTFYGGSQNNTVMAIKIDSGLSNRTLTGLKVKNIGTLNNSYISSVKLWYDRGSIQNEWDSEDLFVANLTWNGSEWANNSITFNTNLAGGKNFVITIDISQNATNSSFRAQIDQNWITATGPAYGPSANIANNNSQLIRQSYKLIDDFSSQAQYGSQLNDFNIGSEAGEYTDDDNTMRSTDFVTNDGTRSYLILRWNYTTGGSYWYSVLDDDGPATDGIQGFPATNYQGVRYQYLVITLKGNAAAAGRNFGIVLRDYNNIWGRKNLTDYLPGGIPTSWTTIKMPLSDWQALGVNLGILKSVAFDNFPTGGSPNPDLYVDEIGLEAYIPTPVEVTKITNYPDGPYYRLYPGETNKEVLAINIKSSKNNDKLSSIKIKNAGTTTPSEILAVKLWFDKNGNKKWDASDEYICNLNWNSTSQVYSNSVNFASNISGSGRNFIITVNLSPSAIFDRTFEARINQNYITTLSNLTGPNAGVGNSSIHIFNNKELIDDFSSQSRYSSQCNDKGFYTDDDGTMGWGNDFVTNEDWLVLKWNDSTDYWFSVINDITGFDTTLYSNIGFDAKSTVQGLNFKVTLRDINNKWEQKDVTNYISGGIKTNWQHIDIKISDYTTIDRTKLKTFTIEGFSVASGTLYLDNLKFNSGVNVAPQITITKVTQTNNGTGRVYINYNGIDANNDQCSYTIIQFSTNNSLWVNMTKATNDTRYSKEPLQFKASGTNLTFVWDSISDLPSVEDASVWIRIQVSDGSLNSAIKTNGPFLVDNKAPSVVNLISPIDNKLTNNNKPNFIWNKSSDISGIRYYTLKISNNSSTYSTNLSSTNWTPLNGLTEGTNYWYVTATDNKGNKSSPSIVRKIIIDTTPPAKVKLVSPQSNIWTNSLSINFVWNKSTDNISGISNYKIEISKTNNFANLFLTNLLNSTNYVSSLEAGTFYWRVKAFDKARNEGEFSTVYVINIDTNKPYVTSPIPNDNSTNNSVSINFSWTGIDIGGSGIKSYEIRIDTDSNTNNGWEVIKTTNVNSYHYTFSGNGTYFWKVRATDNAGNIGQFSVWKLTINTNVIIPNPLSPVSTYISNSRPNFIWSDVSANYYNLQIATNTNFTIKIIDVTNITTTNYQIANSLSEEVRYYWRVRANTGSWQSFSSIVYFNLDRTKPLAPTLLSPNNNLYTTNQNPIFSWQNLSDASGIDYYTIQVSLDSNFSSTVVSTNLPGTSYTQKSALSENRYYWRVRAKDKAGNIGDWSSIYKFTIDITKPSKVSLISPESNSVITNTQPNFIWHSVSDATNYEIQVSTNSSFLSLIISKTLSSTNWKSDISLATNRYYWRVRAKDKAGNIGEWSSIWLFNIISDTEPPLITLLVPNVIELKVNETYTIIWQGNDVKSGIGNYVLNIDGSYINLGLATNYKIKFDKAGNFVVKIGAYDKVGNYSEVSINFNVKSGIGINQFGFAKNPIDFSKVEAVKIYYNVENDNEVEFEIYTVLGTKVKEVKGRNGESEWDGTNESGKKVASGVYLVIMKQAGKVIGKPYKIGVLH